MEVDAIQRARARLTSLRSGETSKADLSEVVTRAREELEELSKTAAELKVSVPEQVNDGIRDAIQAEVLPVARHIAEIRGLSTQVIKRIERAQSAIEAEREARIDDLDVVVDLLVSNWQGLDARLSRIEARLSEPATSSAETDPQLDAAEPENVIVETEVQVETPAPGDNGETPLSAVSEPPSSQSSAVG